MCVQWLSASKQPAGFGLKPALWRFIEVCGGSSLTYARVGPTRRRSEIVFQKCHHGCTLASHEVAFQNPTADSALAPAAVDLNQTYKLTTAL